MGHATALINRILDNEGGVKDVGDGKGLTRWGQTPDWLEAWDLPIPKSRSEAASNYFDWLLLTGLVHVAKEDDLLSFAIIDWAIHSGHRVAIKSLQRTLKIIADGKYGPQTQRAVDAILNRSRVAAQIIAERLAFLGRITRDKPSNAKYIYGWLNRMSRQVKELGNATA